MGESLPLPDDNESREALLQREDFDHIKITGGRIPTEANLSGFTEAPDPVANIGDLRRTLLAGRRSLLVFQNHPEVTHTPTGKHDPAILLEKLYAIIEYVEREFRKWRVGDDYSYDHDESGVKIFRIDAVMKLLLLLNMHGYPDLYEVMIDENGRVRELVFCGSVMSRASDSRTPSSEPHWWGKGIADSPIVSLIADMQSGGVTTTDGKPGEKQ